MVAFSAVILAGGESRRMGRDKAWIEWEGRPLIEWQIALLRDLGPAEIFISGHQDTDYTRLGLPVIYDREPCSGPLAGITQALETAPTALVLILAVDMPWMTAEVLQLLLSRGEEACGAIPRLPKTIEPLAALYPKSATVLAAAHLSSGRRSATHFAERCVETGLATYCEFGADQANFFKSCNSPNDLFGRGEFTSP